MSSQDQYSEAISSKVDDPQDTQQVSEDEDEQQDNADDP